MTNFFRIYGAIACFFFSTAVLGASKIEATQPADIVDILKIDSSIQVAMAYATIRNFTGRKVEGYQANVCYLTTGAARALSEAQRRLQKAGAKSGHRYSLLLKDCYRPQKAVLDFVAWSKTADVSTKSIYYPDLTKAQLIEQNYISPSSGHSRASSIDLTIVETTPDGKMSEVPMGTPFDFFGEKSHTASPHVSVEQTEARKLLLSVMSPDFKNYANEWWHFALKVEPYPTTFFNFDVVEHSERTPQMAPQDITTHLTDAALMVELDSASTSIFSLVGLFKNIHEQNGIKLPTIDALAQSSGDQLSLFTETYGKVASTLTGDITKLVGELGIDWEKDITQTYNPKAAKTDAGKILRGNGNVTRIFNEKWLTSKTGQFILAGISNRIDRREFSPGTCGEVRFIYRLGYQTQMQGQTFASRTPFTLNLVYTYKDDGHGCRDVASAWNLPSISQEDPKIAARRLIAGPLSFSKLTFKQLELNAQVARFPSDLENVENRRFAGQAIYLMRIFGFQNGGFQPRKLENTPDVSAIKKSPELQKTLRSYIAANLKAIDNGTFLMPDDLLAEVAISYSTLGSSRLANKPFDLLISSDEAQNIIATNGSKGSLDFIGDGRGLLERLNTSTCMGCHQASSTAGFHFLGVDRFDFGPKPSAIKVALDGNRLVLPFSPHLFSDLPRRSSYVTALANGIAPDTFRPHPSRAIATADAGMPCPLPGETALASRATWSCSAGFTCSALVTNPKQSLGLGQCIPSAKAIYGGLSCRKSAIIDETEKLPEGKIAYNARSFTDHVSTDDQIYKLPDGKLDAVAYNCRPTKIGVPLGRVTKQCTANQMSLKDLKLDQIPNEICAVVGGKGFEEMAKGYFSSAKFAEGVGRGILNTCSSTRFCREDYICQEMPDFLTGPRFAVNPTTMKALRDKKVGFCTPTYFVYQLRLDGHPNPL